MDINQKAEAAKTLIDTFVVLGNEPKIDSILNAISGTVSEKEENKRAGGRRGPYKRSGFYKACAEGPASLPVIASRVETYDFVPGKTDEDKQTYVRNNLRKSPAVYREYPDGSWGLRRNGK